MLTYVNNGLLNCQYFLLECIRSSRNAIKIRQLRFQFTYIDRQFEQRLSLLLIILHSVEIRSTDLTETS